MPARPEVTAAPRPIVRSLPGRYYADPGIYQRERDRIFARLWIYGGHIDQLAEPGSILNPTIADESILIVRGQDREIRAFYNVCPHRGARLATGDNAQCTKLLQCPYHAWSFALDGRLAASPMLDDLEARGFDRSAYGLRPIAVDVWHGMIWINLDAAPPPLAPQLQASVESRFGDAPTFERYTLESLRHVAARDYVVATNWKLVIENFMECTHCGPMHPDLVRLVPAFRTGKASYHNGGQGVMLAPGAEAFSMSEQARYPRLSGLLVEDMRRFHAFVIRPNVMMVLVHDHVVVFRLLPLGPDRTHIRCQWLFDPAAVAPPYFDPSDAVTLFDTVNRQDWEVLEQTQAAMGSRAFEHGGILGPSEEHLREFDDYVLALIED